MEHAKIIFFLLQFNVLFLETAACWLIFLKTLANDRGEVLRQVASVAIKFMSNPHMQIRLCGHNFPSHKLWYYPHGDCRFRNLEENIEATVDPRHCDLCQCLSNYWVHDRLQLA